MNRLRRRTLQLIALLAGSRVGAAFSASPARRRLPSALGYLPWWMAAGWEHAVSWSHINRLVLFDSPIQPDGSLLPRDWLRIAPGLASRAGKAGVPLDLALTLLKESEFNQVFADRAARSRLLTSCMRALEQGYLAGLHLDVEGYGSADPKATAGFRDWLEALDTRRREVGKDLSAFFPASDAFAAHDSSSAARIDFWVAQLYDAHWPEAKVTGPLMTRRPDNPVSIDRALARLARLEVAREAVLLSVPLYGWQWPSESDRPGAAARGKARLLSFAETPAALMPNDRLAATELATLHGLRRDAEHTPYYAFHDGRQWNQGWYEDFESLTRKLAPERTEGYAGLAFFPLGYDKGQIVQDLLRWWRSPQR
jgi:spore germination protein YaaH